MPTQLHQMIDGGGIPPGVPGDWTGQPATVLHTIATNTAGIVGSNISGADALGIPSIWAHALLFEAVIRGLPVGAGGAAVANAAAAGVGFLPTVDAAIEAEWRGMIGLLGAAGVLGLKMGFTSAAPVAAADGLANALMRAAYESSDAMRSILPLPTLAAPAPAGPNWCQFLGFVHVANVDGALCTIGMLLPSILICPARDFRLPDNVAALIPWLGNNGRLTDPLGASGLAPVARQAIHKYVTDLLAAVDALGVPPIPGAPQPAADADVALRAAVANALVRFQTALAMAPGMPAAALAAVPPVGSLPSHPLFGAMGITYRLAGVVSDLFVPCRAQFAGPMNGAIIIPPDSLPNPLGLQPTQITVLGGVSLAAYRASPVVRSSVKVSAALLKVIVLDEDAVFTPAWLQLPDGQVFPGHPVIFSGRSYPLTPSALLFLPPRASDAGPSVQQNTTFDGGSTVSVAFSVQSVGGLPPLAMGGLVHVRRTYSAAAIVTAFAPEAFACWPNFTTLTWTLNYVFIAATPVNSPELRMVFEPSRIAAHLAAQPAGTAANVAATLTDGAMPNRGGAQRWNWGTGGLTEQLIRIEQPAEALILDWQPPGPGPSRPPVLVGMVFPKAVHVPPVVVLPRTISLDIGTTGITVAEQNGMAPPNVVDFPSFVSLVTQPTTTPSPVEESLVNQSQMQLPFASLLQMRPGIADDPIPLASSFIPMRVGIDRLTALVTGALGQVLGWELKWNPEQEFAPQTAQFHCEIILLCLAKAVADGIAPRAISIRAGYPLAMSPAHKVAFSRRLQSSLGQVFLQIAAPGQLPPAIGMVNESKASARAMIAEDGSGRGTAFLAITLDVGGQTTDAAFWAALVPRFQGSVDLAGRAMLSRWLAARHDVLWNLIAPVDAAGGPGARLPSPMGLTAAEVASFVASIGPAARWNGLNLDQRQKVCDLLIGHPGFGKAFIAWWVVNQFTTGLSLRALATIGFSGLVTAFVSAFASAKSDGDVPMLPPGTAPHIIIGGRASLLFNVLFGAASNWPFTAGLPTTVPQLPLTLSPNPKQEVAKGAAAVPPEDLDFMVTLDLSAANLPDPPPAIPYSLGEDIILTDATGTSSVVSAGAPAINSLSIMAASTRSVDPNLPETTKFLNQLMSAHAFAIPNWAAAKTNIAGSATLKLVTELVAPTAREGKPLSPPFLEIVKEVVRQIADGVLTVTDGHAGTPNRTSRRAN